MLSRASLAAALARPAARLPMPHGWSAVRRVYLRQDIGHGVDSWARVDRADAAALYQRGARLTVNPDRPWLAVLDTEPLAPLGSCY